MSEHRSLAASLAALPELARDKAPTIADIADHLAEKSALALMLFLGAVAMVPSPGLPIGLVFGAAVMLLALRMLLVGQRRLTIPDFLARRALPATILCAVVRRVVPAIAWIEARLRPRLGMLAAGAGAVLALVMLLVQGAVLALPIPLGNLLPGAAIALICLGLMARDGLVVLAGHAVGIGAAVVMGVLTWGTAELAGRVL